MSTQHLQIFNREANQITREALETALLFLLETKDLAKISISELVKKAGVSRQAFYRNYKSKEQMLEGMIEQVIRRLSQELDHYSSLKEVQQACLAFFREAKAEARLLKLAFQYNLDQALCPAVAETLNRQQPKEKNAPETNPRQTFWNPASLTAMFKRIADSIAPAEQPAD